MIELRPYQKEAVSKAIDYFHSESREPALIVLPTAWGKSILTAFVARSIPESERLLVVQPSKELLEQNYRKYMDLCGEETTAGIYSASFGKKQIERITYATIGSIKNLGVRFKELGFTKMLIDEAHLYPRKEESMLGQFISDSDIHQVLGITATPLKLESFSEKQGERFDRWSQLTMLTNPSPSGTFFKHIIHMGQIQEMTSLGFWSPLRYERLPFDPSMLRLNTTGGEFSADSEEEAYKLNNIRENIYGALDYHAERKHCVVFVPTVLEAEILAADYPSSTVICGETPKKEREMKIQAFKEGKIRVISNVSAIGTGFDYPEIDMIVFGMSTASVARYYQFCGRGVRIHPAKKDCIIVDMGGNVDRFGPVENIRFEFNERWRMFGDEGILLTGMPIHVIGKVDRVDIEHILLRTYAQDVMDFGKHKGKRYDEIPMSYRIWLMTNMYGRLTDEQFENIIKSIEDKVRDTRNEPAVSTMPNGKHAGQNLQMIPKGYLAWMYNSTDWNETNDSLKRGIEHAYGGIPPYFSHKG